MAKDPALRRKVGRPPKMKPIDENISENNIMFEDPEYLREHKYVCKPNCNGVMMYYELSRHGSPTRPIRKADYFRFLEGQKKYNIDP